MAKRCFKLSSEILNNYNWLSLSASIIFSIKIFPEAYAPEVLLFLFLIIIILLDKIINFSLFHILLGYIVLQYYQLLILPAGSLLLYDKTLFLQFLGMIITVFAVFTSQLLKEKLEVKILFILLILFLNLLLSSANLISFYICLEAASFSIFLLSVSGVKTVVKIESTIKYFIVTALSSTLLLFSISLVYLFCDSINFYNITLEYSFVENNFFFFLPIILFFSSLILKIGLFPGHS